ncbi:hypothetical protein [Streptomyces sp. NPDC001970]
MTAEQRCRAFDRFGHAPDAPKGGTGLGLALVQRLTLAGGGEALLLPAPGGGLPTRSSASGPRRPAGATAWRASRTLAAGRSARAPARGSGDGRPRPCDPARRTTAFGNG